MGSPIRVVNPSDRDWTRHRYVLWFGACGPTRLMVWANGLDSALELAGEWLAEHAPGHIMAHDSEELRALVRASAEDLGLDLSRSVDAEYRAHDHATADLTYTEAGYLTSWEWGIDLEDPTRATLLAFADAIGAEFAK